MSAGVAWPAKPALTSLVYFAVFAHNTATLPLQNDPHFPLILAPYRDIDKWLARHFCSTIAPLCRQVPTYRDTACRDMGVRKAHDNNS